MVIRGSSLKKTLSQYLVDRIYSTRNIRGLVHSEATAIEGDTVLRAITITDRQTGEQHKHAARWLFVCIGGAPNTVWAAEVGIVRDEAG